ncbi:ABC uptake transporter, substrate-binding protein [Candidatus Nitrososphaera gargensis Ga9.2]|uniref:ABC uptake transporter, substrate-binding protein n=2 Tax=Candidatus Nitrososphaera gargensis TaxID=497727 RepID=K0ID76_NITGG|nr:ABC uptake transporter, substrate-binding protein [Candidatus Nitrososphaera gargensis Ga9.2]
MYAAGGGNNNSDNTISSSVAEDNVSSRKLNVVTSVAPITNIVRNVGGDRIELTGIVPEGVNSHTFELTPSDAVVVRGADLVIINGLHLEVDFERVVDAAGNPNLQLLKLADNTITSDQWVFDFSFPEEEGDPNPHLWLNVQHAMKYAELVRDKLIEMDPANSDYYSSNAKKYLALLEELDQGIMQSVQTVPPDNRKLVTYHDSWAYFAPRYGMTVIGAVQPSDFGEPTPQEVARIIEQIRAEGVPAIFASEVFPSKVVDQIAREANVQIVETLRDDDLPGEPGDPENTYVGMMVANMNTMLTSLGGNTDALEGIDPSNTYTRS